MKNQRASASLPKALLTLTLTFLFVVICNCSFAATKTWTGAVSTDWANPGNWRNAGVPGVKDDVIIPAGTTRKPVISTGTFTVQSVVVQRFATLTQTGGTLNVLGKSFEVSGVFTQSAGSLYTDRDFKVKGGGTFNQSGTGLLHLAKSGTTIPVARIDIDRGATVNQAGGTIYTKDYSKSPGNFNQTGATALFKVYRDWKPGGGSNFNSTAGTVQFTGKANKSEFGNGTNQFSNILIDAGADPDFRSNNNSRNTRDGVFISGNFTNNNPTLASGSGNTFTFNGSSTQNIYSAVTGSTNATFGNIVINNNGGTVLLKSNANIAGSVFVLSGTYDLGTYTSNNTYGGGLLYVASNAKMRLAGASGGKTGSNFPNTYYTYLAKTSTTEYYGSGQIMNPLPTYGNVVVSNAGTKTAGGNLNIAGSFNLSTATFVGGNYSHNVGVDWTMTSGTFNNTGSKVTFNGTGPQKIASTGAFNNVTVNKFSGSTTLATDITVGGTLNFTKGIVTTGTNKMVIPAGGSVTGAGASTGWVNGNLQKHMASVAGGTFEIGDAISYSPVSASFSGAFTPGSMIAKVNASKSPNVATSNMANKSISRYWNLSKSSTGPVSFGTANLSFNWKTADNFTPLVTSLLKVANYTGSAWSYPAVTGATSTTITATGVTTLGDFTVGESTICLVSSGFSYSKSQMCTSGGKEDIILTPGATAGSFSATPAGLNFVGNKGSIMPSSSAPGIYTVTNTVSGACPSVSTTTIEIIAVSASISYPSKTYCQTAGTADVILTGEQGGTFASTSGLVIDNETGRIDLASSTPGTYTVSYTAVSNSGCPVTATYSITVTAANYANIAYLDEAYCLNGGIAAVDFDGTIGGVFSSTAGLSLDAVTGSINLGSSTPGTYAVTYSGAAANGCAAFTGTTSITITATSPGTISYTGNPFCYTAGIVPATITGQGEGVFSAPAGLEIDNVTGEINLDSSMNGTYVVTYSYGGCYTTTDVNVTAPIIFSYPGSPACGNIDSLAVSFSGTTGGTFSSTAGLSIDAVTGQVDPSASAGGNYIVTYSLSAAGGCAAFSQTAPVTIVAAPAATILYEESPFCSIDPKVQTVTITGTTGGVFSSSPGLRLDPVTGTVIASLSTPGTHTVTYTIPASGPCPAFVTTTTVTITIAPYAIIAYPAAAYCKTVATNINISRTGNASGTYTSTPGLALTATTGVIRPSTSTPGTYTVTYAVPAAGGCSAFFATTVVTITAPPSATIAYPGTPFCKNITTPTPVTLTGTAGGTFSAPGGLIINNLTGAITPSLSAVGTYTVTYFIPATGECAAFSTTTTVSITAGTAASISYTGSPFCDNNATAQTVTRTGSTGGVYSSTPGLSINPATGAITPSSSVPGTYLVSYTIAASGSCPAYIASTTISVNPKPVSTIMYVGSPYCSNGGSASVTLVGTPGGTFSSAAGVSINSTNGAVSVASSTPGAYTVTYTIPASGGCSAITTTTPITVEQHAVWNGRVSKNWHDPANWSCGGVPTLTSDAVIPSGLTNYPIIYLGLATTRNLTIQTGASILDSASLTIAGVISNSGFINGLAGKVEFAAASTQVVPANLFLQNTLKTLEINNAAGITLAGPLKVSGSVGFANVNNSVLNTGGFLTLGSVAAWDAQLLDITNNGLNSGNRINGQVTVERYVSAKRAYRFLTAPVNSTGSLKANWMENAINPDRYTRINPFPGYGTNITGAGNNANGFDPTQTQNPSVFVFNNALGTWSPIQNTSGIMSMGNTYRIIVRGDRTVDMNTNTPPPTITTLRTKGNVLTGTINMARPGAGQTLGMPSLSDKTYAYNFIGNPYPAVVDWLTVSKTDISSTIYVYDPTIAGSSGRGAYVSFNSAMGISSNNSSPVDNFIQSGQAFFVQTTGQNPSITFKETDKAGLFRSVFRTSNNIPNMSLQLQLSSQANTPEAADGLKVFFSNNFSNSVGNEDSYKFTNLDENIGIMRNGTVLSIEGRKAIGETDTVSIKIWQLTQKNYILKINFDKFPDNVEAFLEDKFLHTTLPLNTKVETKIPFDITTDPASLATDRFKVVFQAFSTLPLHLLGIKAQEKNDGVEVGWTAESEVDMNSYEVEKSKDGNLFVTAGTVRAKLNPGPSSFYTWFDLVPFQGDNYYRIKSLDNAGVVKYSNVTKVKILKAAAGISVFPNPVQGRIIRLQFKNIRKGNFAINLVNANGEKVFTGTIYHNQGTANHAIQLNSSLPAGVYQLQVSDHDDMENISVMLP